MENLYGIGIGLCTFLIIGLFHPLVIKGYYYFGLKANAGFFTMAIIATIGSLSIDSLFWSIVLGVIAFSSFWSIKEIYEQKRRVEKGWFPGNPRLGQKPIAQGES